MDSQHFKALFLLSSIRAFKICYFTSNNEILLFLSCLTLDECSLKVGIEKLPSSGTPMLKTFDRFDSQSPQHNYQAGERCSSHPHHTVLYFSPLFWHPLHRTHIAQDHFYWKMEAILHSSRNQNILLDAPALMLGFQVSGWENWCRGLLSTFQSLKNCHFWLTTKVKQNKTKSRTIWNPQAREWKISVFKVLTETENPMRNI